MAPHSDPCLPGGEQIASVDTRPRILVLTRSGADAFLTRGQGQLILSQTRLPVSPASLIFFDLNRSDFSSVNPPDDATRRALAHFFVTRLIQQGQLFSQDPQTGVFPLILLKAPTQGNRFESDAIPFHIRPASWQPPLAHMLRTPGIVGRFDNHLRSGDLAMQAGVCPVCQALVTPGRTCGKHPEGPSLTPAIFRIKPAVQRLIWLAVSLARTTQPGHSRIFTSPSILVTEPKLLQSGLNLLISFLQRFDSRLLLREVVVWPPQAFAAKSPISLPPLPASNRAQLLAWPGWRGPDQPPPGRARFMQRMTEKWAYLNTVAGQPLGETRSRRPSAAAVTFDRWLLHSLNLVIAKTLSAEEARRAARALDILTRFVSSSLLETWLRLRRKEWDAPGRELLRALLPILHDLLRPYGLSGPMPPPTATDPIKLYREDWIFIPEYKLVETALGIQHRLNALKAEIRRTGLDLTGRIVLCPPQIRYQAKDLLTLMRRLNPGLEVDVVPPATYKNLVGLKGQDGVWRLALEIEDPTLRQALREHHETRLKREQTAYDGFKALYMAHKGQDRHLPAHLKTMRGKLLRLKKRQMLTLGRIHELQ